MNAKQLREHVKSQCGFGGETPRTVEPNVSNETRLPQGTKVMANGYPGVIVRHYDGEMYEIRLQSGVVCTDQWELPETAGTKYSDNTLRDECGRKLPDIQAWEKASRNTPSRTMVKTSRVLGQCRFNKSKQGETLDLISQKRPKPYALQVCNAGAMPDRLPTSFEDWIKQGNDAIDDPGGNIIPSRVQANHDQYDNERHPFN